MCLELFTGTETKLYRMTNIHTIKCSYLPKQCSHIQTALWELFLAHISSPAMPSISLEKANLADVKTIQENTRTVKCRHSSTSAWEHSLVWVILLAQTEMKHSFSPTDGFHGIRKLFSFLISSAQK